MLSKTSLTSLLAAVGLPLIHAGTAPSCPVTSSTPLSCSSNAAGTCCYNAPGGLLLQTQFWDTNPASGPTNSWTVHGLWPDNCDGTYAANCDPSRAYTNITQIIQASNQTLLNYMNTYWTSNTGTAESFWEHEFAKHGTCIDTLNTTCYQNYHVGDEVVDFFRVATSLFKNLPSYQWLSDAGIVPSSSATYTMSQILTALGKNRGGYQPIIQCTGSNNNQLDEIWYFFNTKGNVQSGQFIPTNEVGSSSNCPSSGIQYLPKSSGSPAPTSTGATTMTTATSTTAGSSPTSTSGFSGKGYLYVTGGGSSGSTNCIISSGKWYDGSGTCATFTAGSGNSLSSSKGPCMVDSTGLLSCASGNAASAFTNDGNNGLTYQGNDVWWAANTPSGSSQVSVYDADQGGYEQITITWSQQ